MTKRDEDNITARKWRSSFCQMLSQDAASQGKPLLIDFTQTIGVQNLRMPIWEKAIKNTPPWRLDKDGAGMGFSIRAINTKSRKWIDIEARDINYQAFLKAPSMTTGIEDGLLIFIHRYFLILNPPDYSRYRILSIMELFQREPHRFVRLTSEGNTNRINVSLPGLKPISAGGQPGYFYDQLSLVDAILQQIEDAWAALEG
jgi:hypothetical protein